MKNIPNHSLNLVLVFLLTCSLSACPEWFKTDSKSSNSSSTSTTTPESSTGSNTNTDPGSATNSDASKTTITPDGSMAKSQDGLLTLTFPTGAVGMHTEIAITKASASDLISNANPNAVTHVYKLEPDGLAFSVPVTATLRVPTPMDISSEGVINIILKLLGLESSNGALELLRNQSLKFVSDKNEVIVEGTLRHFSQIFVENLEVTTTTGKASISTSIGITPKTFTGENGQLSVGAHLSDGQALRFSEIQNLNVSVLPSGAVNKVDVIEPEENEVDSSGLYKSRKLNHSFLCNEIGSASFDVSASFTVQFGDTSASGHPALEQLRDTAFTFNTKKSKNSECIDPFTTPPSTDPVPGQDNTGLTAGPTYTFNGTSDFIGVGIEAIQSCSPPNVIQTNPDGTFQVKTKPGFSNEQSFANFPSGQPAIGVGHDTLSTFINPNNASNPFYSENGKNFLGNTCVSKDILGPTASAVVLHYGAESSCGDFCTEGGSFIADYCPDIGDFTCGFVQLLDTIYDAQPIFNQIISDGLVTASGNDIGVYQWITDSEGKNFMELNTTLSGNPADYSGGENIASGGIVSVATSQTGQVGGSELFDGTSAFITSSVFSSTAGDDMLYVFNPMANKTTEVGQLRRDSRKIRCKDPLCAVTNYGVNGEQASGISVYRWHTDSGELPVLVNTLEIGSSDNVSGIVDLDLIEVVDSSGLPDSIAVVTSGFIDSTIYTFRLNLDGNLISKNNMPVPAECVNPGHAIWTPDSEGVKVSVSCYSSGQIVTLPSLIFSNP